MVQVCDLLGHGHHLPGQPGVWPRQHTPCKSPLKITLPPPAKKSVLEVECKSFVNFLVSAGIEEKDRKSKSSGAPSGCRRGCCKAGQCREVPNSLLEFPGSLVVKDLELSLLWLGLPM